MFTKDDVKHTLDQVGTAKIDPAVETEVIQFGLAAHLFDPVSGQIITIAQPRRFDSGQSEILLTPTQAVAAVAAARVAHLHNVRAAGFAGLDDFQEKQKQASAMRELAHKQEIERLKLDETHAEATAKAAEAQHPKTEGKLDLEQQRRVDDANKRRIEDEEKSRKAAAEQRKAADAVV